MVRTRIESHHIGAQAGSRVGQGSRKLMEKSMNTMHCQGWHSHC